jgi:outer membrane protein assembly factor BamB
MRRPSAVLATACILASVSLVVGCAGKYPAGKQAGGVRGAATIEQPRFEHNVEDWRGIGYSLDWIGYPFPAVTAPNSVTDLVIAGDAVVAQEKGSLVSLLDARTGQFRWTNQLATPLTRFVGLAVDSSAPADRKASTIVALSEAEAFTLAGSSGGTTGREKLSRVASTRPIMLGNQIVFGSAAGEVVGHRLGLGLKTWGFLANGPQATDPVLMGATVGFVTQQGDVVFLDTFEGRLVGRARVFGSLASNPVSDGEHMYLASVDQSVWSFDTDGSTRWRYRTPRPLRSQPTILTEAPGGSTLFVDVPGDGMTALDAATGQPRWNNTNVGGTVIGVRKGKIVVWEPGTLTLLDPANGALVTEVEVPELARVYVDKAVDGNLYCVTKSNLIVKFAAR